MIRKIIHINEELCNGCGICADACHEGAIGIIDGKAHLLRDDYCDGLGDCLPTCPTGAITFVEREAAAYDQEAVQAKMEAKEAAQDIPCGCPGSAMRTFDRHEEHHCEHHHEAPSSQLTTWPVQIQLAPINAPYFDNASLLVAADCTAYAYANFHEDFIRNKVTLIGCPKLDPVDYAEKLTAIISENNIRSLTVVRMEVPCCGGIEYACRQALQNAGKMIPWHVITIATDGRILEEI